MENYNQEKEYDPEYPYGDMIEPYDVWHDFELMKQEEIKESFKQEQHDK